MKLLRYGEVGHEKPGLLDTAGRIRDLSEFIPDLSGKYLSRTSIEQIRGINERSLPVVEGEPRLGACVADVGNIICVGLNYSGHAIEAGVAVPKEPYLFLKSAHCVAGPNDDVLLPPGAEKCDWEVELAVVIGAEARRVPSERAADFVAGYCLINDLSERHFQFELGGDIAKGKSCDGFAPLGPWLVTPDEIRDPQNLLMRCEVSGEIMQSANTGQMVFPALHLVSYISRFMTLFPGDVIATGTPEGVGMLRNRYLKEGDVMTLEVEGLGRQMQRVRQLF